jgi:chromosome segregation ATPase
MSESRLLKKAIALSRAGDARPAREILAHVITANPRSELAWLWYAYNLAENSDRIKVLEECLRHIPASEEAKGRLVTLRASEAVRLRLEALRGDIETEVERAEARLRGLEETLLQGEAAVREAEEACERARARVEETRREIAQARVELAQLRGRLNDR